MEQKTQTPLEPIHRQISCTFREEAIRGALQSILDSKTFRKAKAQKNFLAYIVQESLSGRGQLLKEYVIGTEALGREPSFDPRLDPIVRTEARKLRAKLAKYYETEGKDDTYRIELLKGGYVPVFRDRPADLPAGSDEGGVAWPAPVQGTQQPPRGVWRASIAAALALVLLLMAAVTVYLYRTAHLNRPETARVTRDSSIAVLPLVNLGETGDEFLSAGLTDELIDSLTQISGLRVVARTSAFRFNGKNLDIREIGQELQVNTVLVGTVTRNEKKLRVTAQLSDTSNGSHLWSGNYEIEDVGVGELPREIASGIANAMHVPGTHGGAPPAPRSQALPSSVAQQDYLRGLYFRNKFTAESLNAAIRYYKRAIAEDPSFARAYAALGDCYAMGRSVAAVPPLEELSKIKEISYKAIELDATLGEPHIDLAVSAEYEFDWATADKEFKQGLELSPGNVLGHIWYAWYLLLMGRTDEALREKTIAERLDPVSPYAIDAVGHYYFSVGRYDAALEQYRRALALDPNFGVTLEFLGDAYLFQGDCRDAIQQLRLANDTMPGPRRMAHLGYAYGVCGQLGDARRILNGFLTETHRETLPALAIAEVYLGLGQKDPAFSWLQKSIDERDLEVNLRGDPRFQSLNSDPRYRDLLRRMKLN